jgi:hypothetical protein
VKWLALCLAACLGNSSPTRTVTGTCDGACDHYVECKAGHLPEDRARCAQECPSVFSDHRSLEGYESLQCDDAVEYIDGPPPRTTAR